MARTAALAARLAPAALRIVLALLGLLTILLLLAAGSALACETCPAPGGSLAPPAASCQHESGQTTAACTARAYTVDLVAGSSYTFTTCDTVCPGADADFDTLLRLWSPSCIERASNDDACGSGGSTITYTATETGPHVIEVAGSRTDDVGNFTLGWFGDCREGDCGAPNGTLETPSTECRLVTDSLDCGDQRAYAVTLVQGQRYTFTLCDATCAGAFADFDSAVELVDPTGVVVASSTGACGGDGEVVYETDPMSGGGTYCVRVRREFGAGAFGLGYRVACQPPSDPTLTPAVVGLVEADCARDQAFVVTSSGTGPFALEWSVSPPPGGSATPSSGAQAVEGNSATFATRLAGAGVHLVTVTLTNDCGTLTQDFPVLAEDRRAPDLLLSALAADCAGGDGLAPIARPRPLLARREPARPLLDRLEEPDPGRDLARALAKPPLIEEASPPLRGPGLERPPEADALACVTPCEIGTITAGQPWYEVFVDCGIGTYTARTGPSHPVTAQAGGVGQNVIFGGATGSPGTSDIAFFVHDFNFMYQNPAGGRACAFDPPDTPGEPDSTGIEQEWTVQPDPDVELVLRQEVVAFGTSESDSGVRLTLGITNSSSSAQSVTTGVRWQIDYQNSGDDGPLFATVACDPLEIRGTLDVEHELPPEEVADFYRIQNNTGAPIFGNFTNTTALAGFPDTGRPDRLVYGYWPTMRGAWWDRPVNEGDANVDLDSAVHYWFGADVADGIVLAPGESFRRSVVIFSSGDSVDCGGFVPGDGGDADLQVCAGDCAELSATAADGCGLADAVPVSWTPGAPPCGANPCTVEFTDPGSYTYTWEATDEAGNATQATTTVEVLDSVACGGLGCEPSIAGPPADQRTCAGESAVLDASGLSLARCDGTIEHVWSDGAGVVGTGPVIEVSPSADTLYTVTVECSTDPACFVSDEVLVEVDLPPAIESAAAVDPSDCNLGLLLSWSPAEFPTPAGAVYNVYRSETGCADALASPPVALGLTASTWLDVDTRSRGVYWYVVEAEDGASDGACTPTGAHHGGAAARTCTGPVTDAGSFAFPDGVYTTLFAGHEGHEVTFRWESARDLLAAEHFHLLKTVNDPTNAFGRVNPEGDLSRGHVETDRSSPLQFFDLRVANGCEDESLDEYPPTGSR